jgi:hypothetical protein
MFIFDFKNNKPPRHLKGYYKRKFLGFLERNNKILKKIFLIFLFLFLFILVIGYIPISSNLLKTKLIKEIEGITNAKCSLTRISVTLWRGFIIENFFLEKNDNLISYTISIPKINLSYNIFLLVFKCLIIKDFHLEKPQLNINFYKAKNNSKDLKASFDFSYIINSNKFFNFSVIIKKFSCKSALIYIKKDKKDFVSFLNLSSQIKLNFSKQIKCDGKITCKNIFFQKKWKVENFYNYFSQKDSYFTIEKCKMDFCNGKISVTAQSDLKDNLLKYLNIDIGNINLNKVYELSQINKGKIEGILNSKVKFTNCYLAYDSLKGFGNFNIANLKINDLPIQRNLLVLIAVPQLKSIVFSKISSKLEIKAKKIYMQNIEGQGEPIDLFSEGWIDFNAYFCYKIKGIFSKNLIASFHRIILNSLEDCDDGRKAFNCTVYGNFSNPHIEIDQKIQAKALRNIVTEIRNFFR